ncbi:hypothetical protein SP5_043_00570 [Sphingomonas parapaucimobilis NBRC 15100]|uniref:Uncharacterized protein n=1 Tax=Sphingomonas parapaucimobilis NBRC 15100 TaxID=1219049 RepID=A0A0A1W6F0_9SPHN|nr:hypothetical protein SP5_043_00570 [Sphingomonas parapaucimobilis NBRC 15100]
MQPLLHADQQRVAIARDAQLVEIGCRPFGAYRKIAADPDIDRIAAIARYRREPARRIAARVARALGGDFLSLGLASERTGGGGHGEHEQPGKRGEKGGFGHERPPVY